MSKPCTNCPGESNGVNPESYSHTKYEFTNVTEVIPANQLPKSNLTLDFSDNDDLKTFITNLTLPYLAEIVEKRQFLTHQDKHKMHFDIPWVNVVDKILNGVKSNSPYFNNYYINSYKDLYTADEGWRTAVIPIMISIIKEYCGESDDVKAQLYINYLIGITEKGEGKGSDKILLPFRKIAEEWHANGGVNNAESRRLFKLTLLPILEKHPYDAAKHTMPYEVGTNVVAKAEHYLSLGISQHIDGINVIIPDYVTNVYELQHMMWFVQENNLIKNSLTPDIVQNYLPTVHNGVNMIIL